MKKILILDDMPEVCTILSERINSWGYLTDTVNSYAEAMSKINNKYDILLIDIILREDKTGTDFAKEYKKLHPGTRVIAFTAHKELQNKQISEAETILDKPIDFDKLKVLMDNKNGLSKNKTIDNLVQLKEELKTNGKNKIKFMLNRFDETTSHMNSIIESNKEILKKQILLKNRLIKHNVENELIYQQSLAVLKNTL